MPHNRCWWYWCQPQRKLYTSEEQRRVRTSAHEFMAHTQFWYKCSQCSTMCVAGRAKAAGAQWGAESKATSRRPKHNQVPTNVTVDWCSPKTSHPCCPHLKFKKILVALFQITDFKVNTAKGLQQFVTVKWLFLEKIVNLCRTGLIKLFVCRHSLK